MDSFLGLIRLALERGWALGALLAVFFGLISIGTTYGLRLPAELQQWSAAGTLFGIAVLLVSLGSRVAQGIGTRAKKQRFREEERAAESEESQEALANLGALDREELEILRDLLRRGSQRFEVHRVSRAYAMIGKGVLLPVREVSALSSICEVHPAILQHRTALLAQLEQVLSKAWA